MASVEQPFSALKRIKSYQRSTQGQEMPSSLSLISIEKEHLYKEKIIQNCMIKLQTDFRKKTKRLYL